MAVQLTDKGEKKLFESGYDGDEVIVGLYNEDNNITYDNADITNGFEEYVYGVYNDHESDADVAENAIDPGERATISRVEESEPDRTGSYSRQTTELSVQYVRRDAGRIDISRDLSTTITHSAATFDVSDNTRVVNAMFVALKETNNLHFTIPLDERIVLDNIDGELVVSGGEVFLE